MKTVLLFLMFNLMCLAHEESNPAFKYSQKANVIQEDEIMEEDIIDLPASSPSKASGHGHSHDGHGHSHGGHGHSHGGHGHSHGGHGHSHGGNQREPTPEERERHRRNLHKIWDDDDEDDQDESQLTTRNMWICAIGSTFLISMAPFFILFFIPLDNSQEKQWILKILLSFASGGLMGDAFLHLIPHAMLASGDTHGHDHGHGHSHGHGHGHSHGPGGEEHHGHDLSVGLGVLSGIVAFLCVEKFVRIMKGGHGHSHGPKKDEKNKKDTDKKDEDKKDEDKKEENSEKEEKKQKKKKVDEKKKDEPEEIKVAGFLNLAADCFHNFTDGLAIGASYHAGEAVGIVTTLTVLLHEVPHEIGDFAILIQSGVPRMKAIFLQLLTAGGAMTGCLVSLVAGGIGDVASSYILPFTAGGFIYIATVSVIPELLEKTSFKQSVMEIVAMLLGVAMMVLIAQYE